MKKWFSIVLIFVISYLTFLLATAPAQAVIATIKLPQNISLNQVSGSIWHANIKQVGIATSSANIIINNVNAKLSVISLLTFNPSLDLTFGGKLLDGPRGKLTLKNLLNTITVENADITIAANEISQQLRLPIAVEALGEVKLTVAQFVAGNPLCAIAKGRIHWQKAAVNAFQQTAELDELSADINCKKGALAIKIDPKNTLGLTFTTYIHSSNQVTGNGYLKPGAKFPKPLQDLLPFLGKPDNNGRYRLRF
jgi:general secretion pathway protein N